MTMTRLNRTSFRVMFCANAGLCGYLYAFRRMGLTLPSGYDPAAGILGLAGMTALGFVLFYLLPDGVNSGYRPGKGRGR